MTLKVQFTASICLITIYDFKTICKYIVFSSCLTLDTTTLTGYNSVACLFSLSATSSIIGFSNSVFCRTTDSGLFVQSGSSRALIQTHPSHSHALCLHKMPEPLHWNSLLPSIASHIFALFCKYVCMCGCKLLASVSSSHLIT